MHEVLDVRWRVLIGKDAVNFLEVSQFDHGIALKFRVISGKPNLSGLLDDGSRHANLAVVKVAQCAVHLDAADANETDIDLELPNEVDSGLASYGLVARAHDTTGNDHLATLVGAQKRSHVEVVGDHAQAGVVSQLVKLEKQW